MRFSPSESWLLIIGAVVALCALVGLFSIIDEAVQDWRAQRAQRKLRRAAIRKNINELILLLCDEEDPTLDRALQDSIVEYRVMS